MQRLLWIKAKVVVTVRTSMNLLLKRVTVTLLAAFLLAHPALAQAPADLGRLIFEPAFLTAEQVAQTADAESPDEAAATDAATTEEPGASPTDTGTASGQFSANSAVNVEPELSAEVARARAAEIEAGIASNEARINELITAENTYTQSLREQYETLADLQQRSGDHEAAVTTLANAMHIDRVNDGLFTLKQIPLVGKIIASHAALGNVAEVDDFHEYLYYIQVKTYAPDDPNLLAAKEAWADWNVEAYLKEGRDGGFSINMSMEPGGSFGRGTDYVAIQNPRTGAFNYVPRNQLPYVLNPNGIATNATLTDLYLNSSAYAVSPELIIDERLRRARDLYEEIIEVRGDANLNADHTAEHKLANIAYIVKRQMDEIESASNVNSLGYNSVMQPRTTSQVVTRGYARNRETLEEIATRLEQTATPVEAARAWIDVGDWHISFDRSSRGQDAYLKAWQLLQNAGLDAARIDAVFAPLPLVPVPAFAIHPYSRRLFGIPADAELAYRGYIDTTLNVDRHGNVRGVKITNVSRDTSQRLRSGLLDFLRETRVRPAVIAGKTVEQSGLNVRYYYTY